MPFVIPISILGPIALWGATIGLSTAGITALLTGVTYAFTAAVGIGLNYLGNRLFAPKAPKPEDRQVMLREPTTPRFRSYGRVKVGGLLAYLSTKSGHMYRVVVTSSGEIDAVEEHWIDDREVTLNGSGVVTSPSVLHERIKIETRLGTAGQTAYPDMITKFPTDWTSDHQGLGMAHAMVNLREISLKSFQKAYPRGEPNYLQVQRASKIYDPREGGQTFEDPTTWTWSENAALCIGDYLTHPDGLNLPSSFVDYDVLETAADDCDDAITLKAGGTVNRWKITTTYSFDERPADILARMLQACDGQIVPTPGGKLGLKVGKWVEPTVTIDEDAITDYEMSRGRSVVDTANIIKSRFTSPLHNWQSTEADQWRDEADITARGELTTPIDFMAAPNHSQCRRLMKLAARRLNPSLTGVLTCNMRGLAVIGERYIRVQFAELDVDDTFEITADPEFLLGENSELLGIRFSVSQIDSDAYAWTAATEEGTAPATPGAISQDSDVEDMLNFSVSVVRRVLSGIDVATADISWDAPVNTALTPEIEIKLTADDDTAWKPVAVVTDEVETNTGPLLDGEDYDVRGRFVAPNGSEGDWTATITFTAVANVTAPAAVTGATLAAGTETVTLGFTTPNDTNFKKVRIYRNTVNNSASATLVQDVFLAPNISTSVVLASVPIGTWYYWLAASNGSNVEAAKTATTPTSVLITGPELVSNGVFASDTVWTKGTDWTIAAGVGTRAAGAGTTGISQPISFVAGGTYRVEFTVSGYVAGTVTPRLTAGTTVTGTARSANGTYTEDLVAVTGNVTIEFSANAAADLSIDNASVKRIA